MVHLLKKRLKELTQEEKSEREYLVNKINVLDYFIGDLNEYLLLKREQGILAGDETLIPLPMGNQEHYVLYLQTNEFGLWKDRHLDKLIEAVRGGCMGLIRCQLTPHLSPYDEQDIRYFYWLGMPVKIKSPKGDPYRT